MPILVQQLTLIIAEVKDMFPSKESSMFMALILTMFHGLLRIGEVVKSQHTLKRSSVSILAHHYEESTPLQDQMVMVTLRFNTSKTDQTGEKHQWTRFGMEEDEHVCPVRALLAYLKEAPDSEWLFTDNMGAPLSQTYVTRVFTQVFTRALGPSKTYKSHSLRMGGAVYLLISGWRMDQLMAEG